MSKAKRKRIEKEAAKQASQEKAVDNSGQGRRLLIIISAVFLVLIMVIIGINFYFSEDQKYYRIDIIQVDDQVIDMDYFIRRCHATGSDPMNALSGLTSELVIKKEAEKLGWVISPEDVENKMIETAQGNSENFTRAEFNEWYRQRLNESGLSDKEYRDIVTTSILSETFYDAIAQSTPSTAEQVHLHIIVTNTEEESLELKARLDAGESFAELAMEFSLDAVSRDDGGDIGWVPRGVVYESRLDETAFTLEIGKVSDPVPYYNGSVSDTSSEQYIDYYLLMVTEKSDSREIDEKYIETIHGNAYDDWINGSLSEHDIKYHGIKNGFDSETYSWINWQLQKMTGESQEETTQE
jgi:parvulin-like peptidyl-prolyl isomerase